MRDAIVGFSARIGGNPALVQGAGGNVSWKDGSTLWVKASGAWLADALKKEIFVPVDLDHARQNLAQGAREFSPKVLAKSALRPSIETSLHAVMHHKVVVHIHAVDVLARLVKRCFVDDLTLALGKSIRWTWVAYVKPGRDLTAAMQRALGSSRAFDVVFLANHGLVIGGETIDEVDHTLCALLEALALPPRTAPALGEAVEAPDYLRSLGYVPAQDIGVQYLALDPICAGLAGEKWALYPDHVVFLGPAPSFLGNEGDLRDFCRHNDALPEYAIIPGLGVFLTRAVSENQKAMLRCYADVLRRLDDPGQVITLSPGEIEDLLGWEAEKYRATVPRGAP